MRKIFINSILKLNKLFPKKSHPFDSLTNGITDMNYTQHEYKSTPELLNQYKSLIDLKELKGKKILEIGSGGGGKTIYIAEKYGAHVTGIDLNQHFLTQANKTAQELGVNNNVNFLEMDALNMTFEENSFDMILMSDVLEHIPNTQKLISEAIRVTKKSGKILFDFAPYYHYNGHHIWDRVYIPWLHLFLSDNLLADIYEASLEGFPDKQKRLDLRVSQNGNKRVFSYLNKISRKDFEKIIKKYEDMGSFQNCTINYFMLKNINIFGKIPLLREIFIRHIVGVIKK